MPKHLSMHEQPSPVRQSGSLPSFCSTPLSVPASIHHDASMPVSSVQVLGTLCRALVPSFRLELDSWQLPSGHFLVQGGA